MSCKVLYRTDHHGLQHQSSTTATKYDYFKLVEIVSILALTVDLYIEKSLLLPRNPKNSESVFNEFTPLDHATEI